MGKSNINEQESKKKKVYTPFPPAPTPSKIDLQLDSGEYFLSERQRKSKKLAEKAAVSAGKSRLKKEARLKEFEAPKQQKDKTSNQNTDATMDMDSLKSKFAKAATKRKNVSNDISDYVDGAFSSQTKKVKK